MMRTLVILIIGALAGFGAAALMGRTEKRIVRRDAVTLERAQLADISQALKVIRDRTTVPSYSRFESEAGTLTFECPTEKACNLEVNARQPEAAAQPGELAAATN